MEFFDEVKSGQTINIDFDTGFGSIVRRNQEFRYVVIQEDYYATDKDFIFVDGEIKDYLGPDGEVNIPNYINGELVVSIGEEAFKDKLITKVNLPNYLVEIKDSAFVGCKIFHLKLPNSVEVLGNSSFRGNSVLETIEFSSQLKKVGDHCFSENTLKSLDLPSSLEYIGDYGFSNNNITVVNFSESILKIDDANFSENVLDFSEYILEIRDKAFEDNDLESVKFMESHITISPDNCDGYNDDYELKEYFSNIFTVNNCEIDYYEEEKETEDEETDFEEEGSQVEVSKNIKLYPNPSKGKITLDYGDLEAFSTSLFDSNGVLIKNIDVYNNVDEYNLDLPVGLYYVRSNTKDGVKVIRFIISN